MGRSTDERTALAEGRVPAICLFVALAAAGCRSDINQQLLERELRLQEDQIYRLQDELHQKCTRLDREMVENSSLRRQLGLPEGSSGSRGAGPSPGRIAPPSPAGPAGLVPPTIEFVPPPSGLGAGGATPPALAPPAVEGLPPPPALRPTTEPPPLSSDPPPRASPSAADQSLESGDRGAPAPSADESDGPAFAPPPTTLPIAPAAKAAAAPSIRRLSYEESLAEQDGIARIVVNPARSGAFDADADGRSDGLAVVFEPRDADERLVTAVGDVVLAAYDPSAAGGEPIAIWEIPARQAVDHFRRSSRARGLHFVLDWPAAPPAGETVRLKARLTTFEGRSFEDEAVLSPVVRAPDPRGS